MLRHLSNGNLGLVPRAASLDFGDVWEQGEFSWTLDIENPTSETVVIESLETTCGCTAPEPGSLTIAPGASAPIRLTMDLSPRRPAEAMQAVSDFSVGVTPSFRRDGRNLLGKGWTVQGRVHRALRPSEQTIAFGRANPLVKGGPAETLRFTARPLLPLSAVEISAEPPIVTAIASKAPADGAFQIAVTSGRELPSGSFASRLQMRPVTTATSTCQRERKATCPMRITLTPVRTTGSLTSARRVTGLRIKTK